MEKLRIKEMYFSPGGNGKKIADRAAKALDGEVEIIDITLPENREEEILVEKDETLVIAMPVFASRLPNKIMPFIIDNLKSNGAKAICFVTYGNRDPGDGLSELVGLLQENGFVPVLAGAVPSQHSFAEKLAAGRPNEKDLDQIENFVRENIDALDGSAAVKVSGSYPPGDYYRPMKEGGAPAVFLKAKPKTRDGQCNLCGACAKKCSMGSISRDNPKEVTGICIKCQACIKACPNHAKYFDDADFLSHKAMLEANFTEYKEIEFFR